MHLHRLSSLIISGLLTITLTGRDAVYTHTPQGAPAPHQAATGLSAASDQWFRTDADHMSIASSPELHRAMRRVVADGR